MKIQLDAIKNFPTIETLKEIASKVNADISVGEKTDFEKNGHFEMDDHWMWNKLHTHPFKVVNGYRQLGDVVWVVNQNAIPGVILEAAWHRTGHFANSQGYFNSDQGIVTIMTDDEGRGGLVRVECEVCASRNALREHVLNGVLKLCGFTQDDWEDIETKGLIETTAPHDMKWWELRDEYVTRQLIKGNIYVFQGWLNDNIQSIMEGNSGQYKLDCILDGVFKAHPDAAYNLRQSVLKYVDDLRALERMRGLAANAFGSGLDDVYKSLMSKK